MKTLNVSTVLEGYLDRLITRFWSRVDKSGECWLWKAGRTVGGYGSWRVADRGYLAHRFAYEVEVGPVPDGLTLDHLCRNRICVRPAHMEPVTLDENLRRGIHTNQQVKKTHCPQGHAYTPENTYVTASRPHRMCRACGRERERNRKRLPRWKDTAA